MKAENIWEYFETGGGRLAKQLGLLILAIWIGCFIGGLSVLVGGVRVPFEEVPSFLLGSYSLLMSPWVIFNAPLLGLIVCRVLFYFESTGLKTWLFLIAAEGLFTTYGRSPDDGLALFCWLVLTFMIGCGFWVYHGWRMNRWNAELLAIEAENAQLKAERDREMIAKALAEEA